MQSIKVLNQQISWKNGEHLGLEGASTVKMPGDKNDADNIFRYRHLDGEAGGQDEENACYVDELFMKRKHGASPGRIPTSPLTRKDDPKLAQWADVDADDDGMPDMSEEMEASRESRRRAALSADGWS